MARRERPTKTSRARPKGGLDETYLEAMSEVADAEKPEGEPAASSTGDSEGGSKRFGAMETARLAVDISGDGQEAIITELSFGGDPSLGADDLVKALDELYGVTSGIKQDQVAVMAARAADNPAGSLRGRFPVARGTMPVPGEEGRVELIFLEGASKELKASFTPLSKTLQAPDLETVLKAHHVAYMAFPGEVLATVEPPSAGEPGQDVFGNQISALGGEASVRAGTHVGRSESQLVAEAYGYATLVGDELNVISPIWISPDQLEAHFVHFPNAGEPRRPESEWLTQLLQGKGVTHGIEETSLEKLCEFDIGPAEKTVVRVACGTPAVPGVDAHLEYTFDAEKRGGTILGDGSVDLRERNAAVSVEAGQLLGEFVGATSGQAGMNLLGEELETSDGGDRTFTAGDNVREEREGDEVVKFYSEIDGNVHIKGDAIQVNEVFVVSGDVNYDVGNIDVRTDVQISGSVCSGFSVRAGGTVTVNGMIESGATVNSQADVLVSQGIVGESTKIVALGNVAAKFIQNSSVMAKGDIDVGSYIFCGHVRAGGRVVIQSGGGDRGGSIVGGEVMASAGIEAKFIGSPSTDRTVVGIGAKPEDAATLSKLKKAIDFCDTHIVRLMRTLGLTKMDSALLTKAIEDAPKARKEFLLEAVQKLKELADTKEKSRKSIDEIESRIEVELAGAQIKVSERVFSDVHVQMGDRRVTVSEDLSQPVFHVTEEGIRYHPQD